MENKMKKLKITILNGSLRKDGVTMNKISKIINLINLYLEKNDIDLDVHQIDLSKKNILDCQGCEFCFFNGKCAIDDNMVYIQKELKWADIIIVGSPVYLNHITGSLKKVLDRISYWAHIMPLLGKRGIVVVTASQSGLSETKNYLIDIFSHFGLSIDFSLEYNRFFNKNSMTDRELEDEIKKSLKLTLYSRNKLSYKVNEIFRFYRTYFIDNKELLYENFEYNYWKNKGYLETENLKGGEE